MDSAARNEHEPRHPRQPGGLHETERAKQIDVDIAQQVGLTAAEGRAIGAVQRRVDDRVGAAAQVIGCLGIIEPSGQPVYRGRHRLETGAVAARTVPTAEAVARRSQLPHQIAAQESSGSRDGDQHGRRSRQAAQVRRRSAF
jgi:hypothetical protein